jgi:hypothetical protein
MKFTLEIELDDELMISGQHILHAIGRSGLEEYSIIATGDCERLVTVNGKVVGNWEVTS